MKSVKHVTVKARDHACSEGFGDLGSVSAMPTAVGEVCAFKGTFKDPLKEPLPRPPGGSRNP